MIQNWKWLSETALEEVKALIQALPREVRDQAQSVAILLEPYPSKALIAEDIAADTLGLFEGASLRNSEDSVSVPPHIILFLDNIWETTKPDETLYRREIRTTCLHELGHYLGLEESDLENRSLD